MTEKEETVTLPDGRVMPSKEYQERLALLSKPFPPEEVEKLPKQISKQDDTKDKCKRGSRVSADGHYCGGWHARSMHLDYVGHAGITDRLNDVDPLWTWEPMGYTEAGTPVLNDGGMWGKLTVLGVTRIGYGDPGKNSGPNAIKETIGDFLRNAAMRFGVATYLWSKSESALAKKQAEEGDHDTSKPEPQKPAGPNWQQMFTQAQGNRDKLTALRNQGRKAGLPEDHGMFAAIDEELGKLADEPVLEGTVTK